ncbi:MAG: hypothetical protein C4332_00365 [Meiothermus sp.]
MKLWLLWLMVLSPAMAQGTVYKLKVTDWSCSVVGSRIVAKGKVLNQSGVPMRAVRVNLRVVDRVVSRVNGVANRTVRGTNSAPIAVRRLANGASSAFVVAVKPTTLRNVTANSKQSFACQIWFRNPDSVQIPTRVPDLD